VTLAITIERDTATPALAAAAQMVEDGSAIVGAMGRRVIRDTSKHVADWGLSHPNKLGGRRTNYWAGIAAKINSGDCLEVSGNSATVTLGGETMPGLMRAFGPVTIVPGTKTPGVKYIPLPARPEAYGMRPREFGTALMVFWGKSGPAGLAQKVPFKSNLKTKATVYRPGLVMYWFKTEVTQPQDRTLLPTEAQWSQSANAAGQEYAEQQFKKISGGAA
jgi:hypothetical protein